MKYLLICLAVAPMLGGSCAWAAQDDFIPPSTFPPLPDATVMAMNQTAAKMLKQSGVARVGFYEFVVDAAGKLTKIGIARSAGDVIDDDKAIAAIEATHFDPAAQGKQVFRLLPIRFTAQEGFYIPPAGQH
jgi:TonB family protein